MHTLSLGHLWMGICVVVVCFLWIFELALHSYILTHFIEYPLYAVQKWMATVKLYNSKACRCSWESLSTYICLLVRPSFCIWVSFSANCLELYVFGVFSWQHGLCSNELFTHPIWISAKLKSCAFCGYMAFKPACLPLYRTVQHTVASSFSTGSTIHE